MKKYVIGIDLGGTKISVASSDLAGNIIYKKTVPTNASEGENKILDRIISLVDDTLKKSNLTNEDILCIGIGSPGPLDTKKGTIITTPNLPFKNFDLVKPIKDRFNIHTVLDNDGNVAAIGEHEFGAGKGTRNMVFITVSTGIGGGAVLNGQIYRGNTSNALEIGHVTLEKDGVKCNCGNCGCVESLASGTAIARSATKAVEDAKSRGDKTSLYKYDNITSKEVFDEAKNGDKLALDVINKALNYLGIFIANIMNVFDPEVIIIGGGVSKAGSMVFDKIREIASKRSFTTIYENTKIVPAKLGGDAGIIGAVALAITEGKIFIK